MNKYIFVSGTSRTGTTLMTTIFDSHPSISMGYELPAMDLPPAQEIASLINSFVADFENDAKSCAKEMKKLGHPALAKLVVKCQLASIFPQEFASICQKFSDEGKNNLSTKELQFSLGLAIVDLKAQKEGNSVAGFKLATASVEDYYHLCPQGYFVCMIRDPRDVFSSLEANNFGRSIDEFTRSWNNFIRRYLEFKKKYSNNVQLVRYEDLVTAPENQLQNLLKDLGLEYCDEVRNFFTSKASVHHSNHMNASKLKQDFFVTSVSRWEKELSPEQVEIIETNCKELMEELGYPGKIPTN